MWYVDYIDVTVYLVSSVFVWINQLTDDAVDDQKAKRSLIQIRQQPSDRFDDLYVVGVVVVVVVEVVVVVSGSSSNSNSSRSSSS